MTQQGDMDRKLVLVTGASGFVGRPLVAALARAGFAVRATIRRPFPVPNGVEAVVIPDLKSTIDWAPVLQGVDAVVHLAGLAHARIANDRYSEFDQVNWRATQRLADAAKAAGVEHFIYISSIRAQVGASAPSPLHEEDEPRPTNYYGRSKLAAEMAIRAAGVPFTIFRPVVIYGPNPKGNMRAVMRLARSSLPIPTFDNRRSLLAIDNLVAAIIFALNTSTTIGETYLVADPAPITTGEMFAILRKLEGRSSTTIPIPRSVMRLMMSLNRARRPVGASIRGPRCGHEQACCGRLASGCRYL